MNSSQKIFENFEKEIKENNIVLYMKGTKEMPMCGFSATVVKILRDKGVVGKFVEFYGDGLKNLTLADRATIANMAPEYGATCGFFPVDDETLKYLRFSGRNEHSVITVEKYAKEQGLWANDNIEFTDTVSLDMSSLVPTISGPKRPQDRLLLSDVKENFYKNFDLSENQINNETFSYLDKNFEITWGNWFIFAFPVSILICFLTYGFMVFYKCDVCSKFTIFIHEFLCSI